MTSSRRMMLVGAACAAFLGVAACGGSASSEGGESLELQFAYEGPEGTAHEIAANLFEKGLDKASDGTIDLQMFPAAQLGSEPELLEAVRRGEIDFIISSTANAATIAPPSGVLSLHYLFSDADEVIKAVSDNRVNEAYMEMASKQVEGAKPLTLFTLPLRNMYANFEVQSVEDIKGKALRVQATKTEDTIFSAYGAQPTHMDFTELYTALQTGVVEVAENAVTYYGLNKHYEVAPIMSMTEHEANCQVLWVSQKTWRSLEPDQQEAVTQAALKVREEQPEAAFELQQELQAKYADMGVKFVESVDKQSFQDISVPMQDRIAENLGPDAVAILDAVRSATGD